MLINLSNHPYSSWTNNQQDFAKNEFISVFDIEFPDISPGSDSNQIIKLAEEYSVKIIQLVNMANYNENNAVHIMGELTFCFAVTSILLKNNIRCIASTTKRISIQKGNSKTSEFQFVRFRDYQKI